MRWVFIVYGNTNLFGTKGDLGNIHENTKYFFPTHIHICSENFISL